MSESGRVLVIGAGVSGLACGLELLRAGREVLVLEAKHRAGGVVGTLEADGFRFETGPNTIPAGSENFRRLCGDLGIADRLIASRSEAKLRYLFHRGRLRLLPTGPVGFMTTPLLSLRGKLRVLSEPFRPQVRVTDTQEEPTFEAFLSERIGPEATRTLAGAFVRGVYAAEIEELGARSAFPYMWQLANEHGGLVRGMFAQLRARRRGARLPGPKTARTNLLSFPTGLHELVDALAQRIGGQLLTNASVRALARTSEGWSVRLAGGGRLRGGAVVLAVPAPVAHRLLAPLAPDASTVAALAGIDHAAVTLCHLGLRTTPDTVLPSGFGFLVPPVEPIGHGASGVLGTLFTSNLFRGRAPAGAAAVTSVYRSADVEDLDEAGLIARGCRDLALALRWKREPEVRVARTHGWVEVIPRYGVGHARRMRAVERDLHEALPGIVLVGSYMAGVSVEDCIARARAVARDLVCACPG